ncbi:MAG: acyl transferase [Flavobacteriales bacterium]|nr:acyl transferase [Flavobacteriales bacterium]MBL6872504.1 acyl transferase [Flavobacteriales bacterium]
MNWVFEKQLSFEEKALKVFHLQANNCEPYKRYLSLLKTDINSITSIHDIPFLPIEFFKSHSIVSNTNTIQKTFTSSGTTGQEVSQHHLTDLNIYTESFMQGFSHFYGKPKDYRILALLPSYLEREGSSLVFMCNHLIKDSQHQESGFYLHNLEDLAKLLAQPTDGKTLLIGVSYALLDLAEQFPQQLQNVIVMETGGMKGQRKEMIKSELHEVLKKAFQLNTIHSEYGMTELLSQAYSKSNGIFETPPWMKVIIRDTQDPFTILDHQQTGGINIIDLANINSCSFIATQDLGKTINELSFELKGRFELSDIRGCNLLIQ